MYLEKLNLYCRKSRKLSLRSTIVFLLIIILPAVAGRVFLEKIWDLEVRRLKSEYLELSQKVKLAIQGSSSDLFVINTLIAKYTHDVATLTSKKKDVLDFLKDAYTSKRLLSVLFDSLVHDKDNWMVLESLVYTKGHLMVSLYNVYTDRPIVEGLVENLRRVGNVKYSELFDVEVEENLRMLKAVIEVAIGG